MIEVTYERMEIVFNSVIIPVIQPIPSDIADVTGRYKLVNGRMFVEVKERSKYWLWYGKWESSYIPESLFMFNEVHYFDCKEDSK